MWSVCKSGAGRVQRTCGISAKETIVVSVDFVSYFLGLRKKVARMELRVASLYFITKRLGDDVMGANSYSWMRAIETEGSEHDTK